MTEETNTTPTTDTTAAPAAEKKTRTVDTRPLRERLLDKYNKAKAKYDSLTTELTDLANEINAIDLLANIGVGAAVKFFTGKGETRAEQQGIVIAVKDDEDGAKLYKVSYGTGFDADVKILKAGAITPVVAAAPAEQPAQ